VLRHIEASRQLCVPIGRAREAMVHDPLAMLGPAGGIQRTSGGHRSVTTELDVASGRGAVSEPVEIEVVRIHLDDHVAAWDVVWHATAHARLLPTFRGTLSLVEGPPASLLMAGEYDPPLGIVGRFGDGVIGHRFARNSLERYLERVAATIEAACRRAPAGPPSWTPREPVDR
jgi:hypothetical protein